MTTPTRAAVLAASFALLLRAGSSAFAHGAAEDVAAGNSAFSRGDLEQAVNQYDRARKAAPGSAVALLDFGLALYAKGDFAGALAAFQQVEPPTAALAATVHYDQGNALAQLGRKAEKDQPDAALDFYRRGVAAYRRALDVDPRLSAAAANIEVVRGWIKRLTDAQSQASNGQQQQPDQGGGQDQGQQTAPGAQAPGNQSPAPGQGQQVPANPAATNAQGTTPPDETPESILQEERDRRQAEATAGGSTANDSPNW